MIFIQILKRLNGETLWRNVYLKLCRRVNLASAFFSKREKRSQRAPLWENKSLVFVEDNSSRWAHFNHAKDLDSFIHSWTKLLKYDLVLPKKHIRVKYFSSFYLLNYYCVSYLVNAEFCIGTKILQFTFFHGATCNKSNL